MNASRALLANVALLIGLVLAAYHSSSAEVHRPIQSSLPEGAAGIAAEHPGDKGIADDPRVLFVENFDSDSLDVIAARWETVQGRDNMSLSADVPGGSADAKSLLMTHVGGRGTGAQLYRRLPPGYKRVFARWYVKFDPDCAPIHHFGTHLGGFNPSTPWPQGGAGERPRGDRRFTSGVEPFGNRWRWDFYTYWQGMHVHGDGRYWGTPFLAQAEQPEVQRGKWICVEMMLKMNDPVKASNGEQAFWIDGKLWRIGGQVASHVGGGFPKGRWLGGWWHPDAESNTAFEGFRWRSTEDLAINYLWTYLYITRAPRGHVSKVWFDNIVVATEYIGPLQREEAAVR